MLKIARNAGAQVVREGSEAQARLKLPADSMASHVEQMIETSAAEWDYRFKLQAARIEQLRHALAQLTGRRRRHDSCASADIRRTGPRTRPTKRRTESLRHTTIAAARKHGIVSPSAPVNIANMQQTLPWIVALVAVAVLAPAVVWFALRPRVPKASPLPTEWTLTARPVFSTDERRVYRQLREALPHHIVLSKLPLVRFCQPTDPQEVRFWYELLGSIHVTFAVCSANGRVLAAIDLDTDRGNSRRVMQIKQSVLAPAACATCAARSTTCRRSPNCSCWCRTAAPPRADRSRPRRLRIRAARWPPSPPSSSRRRDRATLWQDSSFFQDSFFAPDNRASRPRAPASSARWAATSARPRGARRPADRAAHRATDESAAPWSIEPPRFSSTTDAPLTARRASRRCADADVPPLRAPDAAARARRAATASASAATAACCSSTRTRTACSR